MLQMSSLGTRLTDALAMVVLATTIVACGKGGTEEAAEAERSRKVFVDICAESTASLSRGGANKDQQTFMLELENAMTSCSQACDLHDEPSCERLEGHVQKLCRSAANVCEGLCKDTSGSIKTFACDALKGQPAAAPPPSAEPAADSPPAEAAAEPKSANDTATAAPPQKVERRKIEKAKPAAKPLPKIPEQGL